jgi:putative oxidoreductase
MTTNIINREQAVQLTWFLLRVAAGVMFMQSGGTKLFGWFGGMPPAGNTAEFMTQMWIGGVLEFIGGIAVVLGLLTRPVAFILAGEMAVAYWQFHAPDGAWPAQNHGVASVLYCFIFLFMSAYGAGVWSIDALIHRSKPVSHSPRDKVAFSH